MRWRAALAAALLARPALALAPTAVGPQSAVDVTMVVHDGATGEAHMFVGTRVASAKTAPVGFVGRVPKGARIAEPVPLAESAMAALAGSDVPRLTGPFGEAKVTGDLAATCRDLGVVCGPGVVSWSTRDRLLETLLVRLGGNADVREASGLHVVMTTPTPFAPFAEPEVAEGSAGDLVAPDDAHPPRMKVWLELGTETRTGAWERAMDRALADTEPKLARCYLQEAEKKPKLAGDVHVQLRLPPGGAATAEGERASTKVLAKIARCYARELERATWPAVPGLRAVPVEVHAMLKPPVARTRDAWMVVLATGDVEPRLGRDFGGAIAEARVVVSREPEARELSAIDAGVRAALSIDPSKRYRLVVVETKAEARPENDDAYFRVLAPLTPAKPGEPDWPIVAPGDRAVVPPMPVKKRWQPTRREKLAGGLAIGLAFALLVVWLSSRARGAPRA